jgi:hypothetical protein
MYNYSSSIIGLIFILSPKNKNKVSKVSKKGRTVTGVECLQRVKAVGFHVWMILKKI